jgi:hypothetical protein
MMKLPPICGERVQIGVNKAPARPASAASTPKVAI